MAYRQSPEQITGMPTGVPYIVGNELAERFSYYGMKTILVVFMTHHLKNASGAAAPMSGDEAKAAYHLFAAGAYFFPLIGAIISDALLGKYMTIMTLSVAYCLGHLALALDETRLGNFGHAHVSALCAGLAFHAGFGEDAEEGGFSDLRQSDNSCLHKRGMLAQRPRRAV